MRRQYRYVKYVIFNRFSYSHNLNDIMTKHEIGA